MFWVHYKNYIQCLGKTDILSDVEKWKELNNELKSVENFTLFPDREKESIIENITNAIKRIPHIGESNETITDSHYDCIHDELKLTPYEIALKKKKDEYDLIERKYEEQEEIRTHQKYYEEKYGRNNLELLGGYNMILKKIYAAHYLSSEDKNKEEMRIRNAANNLVVKKMESILRKKNSVAIPDLEKLQNAIKQYRKLIGTSESEATIHDIDKKIDDLMIYHGTRYDSIEQLRFAEQQYLDFQTKVIHVDMQSLPRSKKYLAYEKMIQEVENDLSYDAGDKQARVELIQRAQKELLIVGNTTFESLDELENAEKNGDLEKRADKKENMQFSCKLKNVIGIILAFTLSCYLILCGASAALELNLLPAACAIFSGVFMYDLRKVFSNPKKAIRSFLISAILFILYIICL